MKENKIPLDRFVQEDRFELNLYLAYLFQQVTILDPTRIKNKKRKAAK